MDAFFRTLPLALLLLAVVAPAPAGEIHRCRGADGALAFQDQPCAAGATALGALPVEAPPPGAAARRAARDEAARIAAWDRASRARLAPSLGGRGIGAPSRDAAPARGRAARAAPDACAAARARREAAYRRDGNRMGFDRRRELLDAVTEACGLR